MAMRFRALLGLLLFTLGVVAATVSVLDHHIGGVILYACVVIVSAIWQLSGRKLLQALFPCLNGALQRWSPLFTHAGYVFFKELGKDIEPVKPSELEPVVARRRSWSDLNCCLKGLGQN